MSRLGMQLYCVLRMVWLALLWLSSHLILPRVLTEVESWTTTARRVGKGLGILLHYAKESNEWHTKPKLKDQKVRSHKPRGAYTYRRVRIKRPWVGNLRMQRKRGVGAYYVFVHKRHVVSTHHPGSEESSL